MPRTVSAHVLAQIVRLGIVAASVLGLALAPAAPTATSASSITAAPSAVSITAAKRDALATDNNGNGKADPGDTLRYTVVIRNGGSTDALNVIFSDTLDANTTLSGTVRAIPLAANDTYSAIGNVRISPNAASGLLANDSGLPAPTAVPFSGSSAQGGEVAVNSDGSFTYNPPAGFEGVDTFTYTATNAIGSDTATVTINVSGMIWFINDNAGACSSNCNGRLTNPFTSWAAFAAVNDGVGNHPAQNDNIFLYESSTNYSGPINLLNGQKLIGQDATLSLSAVTGLTPPGHSDPLPAMNSGNATVVNITSSSNDIVLAQNNSLYGFTAGNATGTAISGSSFGSLTVSDVTINTAGAGLSLSNGTSVSGSKNVITTTTGVALSIVNTTIGSSGLAFRSISANGAPNGIVLNNTGASGGLTVTGDGSNMNNASGGTIQNTTSDGISLTNTQDVSLTSIRIQSPAGHGILASNLRGSNNLLRAGTITQFNGSSKDGFQIVNNNTVLGSLTIYGSTFSSSSTGNDGLSVHDRGNSAMTVVVTGTSLFTGLFNNAIDVLAGEDTGSTGTVNLTVQSSSFTSAAANGNGGVMARALYNGTLNANIVGNTFNDLNRIGSQAGTIHVAGEGSGSVTANIVSNAVTTSGQRGIHLSATASSNLTAVVNGNQLYNIAREGIYLGSNYNAQMVRYTVTNNTVGTGAQPVATAGSYSGFLIEMYGDLADPTIAPQNTRMLVQNNTVVAATNVSNRRPFYATVEDASKLDLTVTGNTFTRQTGSDDVFYARTNDFGTPGSTLCLDLRSNTVTGGNSTFHLQRVTLTFNVANRDSTAANNTGTVFFDPNIGSFGNVASCQPVAMLMPTQQQVAERNDRAPVRPMTGALVASGNTKAMALLAFGSSLVRSVPGKQSHMPLAASLVNLDLGTLPAGEAITLTFDATINDPVTPGATQIANQGLVSGSNFANVLTDDPDTPTSSDPTITPLNIKADLGIVKSVQPALAGPGQTVVYTLVYSNNGPNSAGNVTIVDRVPVTLTNVSFVSDPPLTPSGAFSYTWDVGTLSVDAGGVITITGKVSASVSGVFSLTNQASIASAMNDEVLGNNTFTVSNIIDAAPPTMPVLVSPVDGLAINVASATFDWDAATDNGPAGVAGYNIQIGANVYTVTAPATDYTPAGLADGTYTWSVQAYDNLGNTGAYAPARTLIVDTQAPNAPALVSPADGGATNDTTPTVDWNAATDNGPSGVAGYNIQIDTNVYTVTAPTTDYTSAALADGVHTWSVRAYDNAGNVGAYAPTRTLIVDTQAPNTTTLANPADGAVTNDTTPTLNWNAATDNGPSGVAGYNIRIDTNVYTVTTPTTDYTSAALGDGVHTWSVRAYDNAGNVGAYAPTRTLIVDTQAPNAPALVSPPNGSVISDTTPTLDWNAATDQGLSGVAGYNIQIDTDIYTVTAPTTEFTVPALPSGIHTWSVRTYDHADNTSVYTNVWTFTLDTQGPALLATAPSNNATEVGLTAPLVMTFSKPVNAGTFAYTVTPDPGGWSATWDGTGKIVTLNHNPFGYWATITVTVVAADDMIGNGLAGAPVAWHLTTVPLRFYLPLAVKSHVFAPDLVVERIIATSNQVQVVVKNQGNAVVPDDPDHEFWVDLYINPGHRPVYNETCQMMGCQGAAWGITWSGSPYSPSDPARRALPLEPGEVFTLTTGGDYYWRSVENIAWPLPAGAAVYAQADSTNPDTAYGTVLENHEIVGTAYNNVTGPVYSVLAFGSTLPLSGSLPEGETDLPRRP